MPRSRSSVEESLEDIVELLTRLVSVEQQRLELEKQNMSPILIQALIDLLTKFTALVLAAPGNAAALQAAQDALAAVNAADASAAALTPAAQAAIDAANAAVPPVTPPAPAAAKVS